MRNMSLYSGTFYIGNVSCCHWMFIEKMKNYLHCSYFPNMLIEVKSLRKKVHKKVVDLPFDLLLSQLIASKKPK